jgi:hypothetical protein
MMIGEDMKLLFIVFKNDRFIVSYVFTLVIGGQIIVITMTENFDVERMLTPISDNLSGSKS